jgi:predicted RNase H-like HicB family nuclease
MEITMERRSEMKFMALLAWDERSSSYHGWFPGLPGARAEAATRESLENALGEALRFCLRQDGGNPGEARVNFWMFEISARHAESTPGVTPEDQHAA